MIHMHKFLFFLVWILLPGGNLKSYTEGYPVLKELAQKTVNGDRVKTLAGPDGK